MLAKPALNSRYFKESIFEHLESLLNFWEVYAYTASNNLHFAFCGAFFSSFP